MDFRQDFQAGKRSDPRHPGATQPRGNILRRLHRIERPQMTPQSDALLQLAIFPFLQFAIQFRLACKNDLKHFSAPRLQVPQQPDFLQNRPIQILGFVDNQHIGLVLICPLNQLGVEREQDLGL